MCNSCMFALSDAHKYSFLQVPYLKRQDVISLHVSAQLQKHHLKSELALLQTLLHLFHLIKCVKC